MNFLNIRYFIVIAEEQSVSAASRKLFVSQQALSEHLKKMEEEVGVPLFKRTTPLTMTVAGECLYEGGKRILSDYDRMINNIRNVTSTRRSHISIGIPTYAIPPYLSELLRRYREKYPQYEADVIKRQHSDIVHNMLHVDLYLSYLPSHSELETVPIIPHDPYCAVFRETLALQTYGHTWPGIKEKLLQSGDLSLVSSMPFLQLTDRLGQTTRDIALALDEFHISPRFGFSSESGELNAQMCRQGTGVMLMPLSIASRIFAPGPETDDLIIAEIPVKSFAPMLAVCYEKGKHLHLAEISFINEMREMFAE